MSLEHFFGHVAGESHRNADGSDRQAIIPLCRVGELLLLEHEPDNPHDINAIRVRRQTGEQIGYLEREFAGEVVSRSAKGRVYRAAIAGIGRPQRRAPYGVALLIIVDDGSARRTRRSRPTLARSSAETGKSEPSAAPKPRRLPRFLPRRQGVVDRRGRPRIGSWSAR